MIRIKPSRIILLGCILFETFIIVLPNTGANADCSQWDMSGDWEFVQTNGPSPQFHLQQTNIGLQGSAGYSYLTKDPCFIVACGDDAHSVRGSVDGSVSGNSIEINAYWNNGTIGVYTGTIGPQGRVQGTTFDKMHPQTVAGWYSNRTASCLPAADAVAPPPKKPPITLPFGSVTTPARRPFPVN